MAVMIGTLRGELVLPELVNVRPLFIAVSISFCRQGFSAPREKKLTGDQNSDNFRSFDIFGFKCIYSESECECAGPEKT